MVGGRGRHAGASCGEKCGARPPRAQCSAAHPAWEPGTAGGFGTSRARPSLAGTVGLRPARRFRRRGCRRGRGRDRGGGYRKTVRKFRITMHGLPGRVSRACVKSNKYEML
nr:hypothetical protein RVX_2070 [Nitratidesulfovibrio sp. HK-II]